MDKLPQLGGLLIAAGFISGVMSLIGYELKLLMWIDTWGEGTGWAIRGATIVVGILLVAMGVAASRKPQQEQTPGA